MNRTIRIGASMCLLVFAFWTAALAESAEPTQTPPPLCSDATNPPTAEGITWPFNSWNSNIAGGTILQSAGEFDWIMEPKGAEDEDCCGGALDLALVFTWWVVDQPASGGWIANAWLQPGLAGIPTAKSITSRYAKMRSDTWGYATLKMRVDDNSVTSQCIINEPTYTILSTEVKFIQIIAPPDTILDYNGNETITFQVKPDADWVYNWWSPGMTKYRFSLNGNPILWKNVPFFTLAELRAAVPNYTTGEIKMEAAGDKDPSLQTNWITAHDELSLTLVRLIRTSELWWFNGESPNNYSVRVLLTAEGVSQGTFKWEVVSGNNLVNLDNGGSSYGDTVTATNDNTVEIVGTGASANMNDITVKFTYNDDLVLFHNLTVFAPTSMVMVGSPIDAFASTEFGDSSFTGYFSKIRYRVENQFGLVLPFNVPLNEDFNNDGQNSFNSINDYPLPGRNTPWANTWGQESGWPPTDPNNVIDTIVRASQSPLLYYPELCNPGTGAGSAVDHVVGG